jgi:hypothetical protein
MHRSMAVWSTRASRKSTIRSHENMTTMLLLCGPLAVVFGALYWVMSFHDRQEALDREEWAKHGVRV